MNVDEKRYCLICGNDEEKERLQIPSGITRLGSITTASLIREDDVHLKV